MIDLSAIDQDQSSVSSSLYPFIIIMISIDTLPSQIHLKNFLSSSFTINYTTSLSYRKLAQFRISFRAYWCHECYIKLSKSRSRGYHTHAWASLHCKCYRHSKLFENACNFRLIHDSSRTTIEALICSEMDRQTSAEQSIKTTRCGHTRGSTASTIHRRQPNRLCYITMVKNNRHFYWSIWNYHSNEMPMEISVHRIWSFFPKWDGVFR